MATFDVLVVGAGSAGSHAAARLARAGLSVALLERRAADEVGYPWVDSIEQAAFEQTGVAVPSGAEFAGPISHMDLFTTDLKHVARIAPYRYVLTHRHPFGQRLIADAVAAGAQLIDRTAAMGPLFEGDRLVGVQTAAGPIRASLVIDASGFARAIARRLTDGQPTATPATIACYREQRRAPGPPPGKVEVVVGARGYTWITTDDHGAVDVGAGTLAGSPGGPEAALASVVASRSDLQGEVLFRGRGSVPLGQPPASLVADGFMQVGDAAFQVLPTSGTGVGGSLIGAHLAADTAIAAFAKGRTDRAALWDYNVRYFRGRGAGMAALDAVRRELQALGEDEVNFLIGRGVVPARLIAAGAHGEWAAPSPFELARAFGRGASRLDLLMRLGIRLALAGAIADHCRAIPETPEKFAPWCASLRRLTSTLG